VGSRISSYRHASPAGATLVTFLATSGGDQWASILRQLRAFRESVDGAFPGRFAWLAEESLHCTLRALDTPASPDPPAPAPARTLACLPCLEMDRARAPIQSWATRVSMWGCFL